MIIQPLTRTLTLDLPQTEQVFRLGAEMRAIVRRSDSGQPLLEFADGEQLVPHSKVTLRTGEQLQLRVIQAHPTVILQIVDRPADNSAMDAALRAVLSHGGSRLPLFEGLSHLLGNTASASLPQQVLTTLAGLASAHAHPPERLTEATRLAEVLRAAGPLLESRLLHVNDPAIGQDLKAQLLRLAAQIRSTLTGSTNETEQFDRSLLNALLDSSERTLARVEAQQLQAISGRGMDLLFELPLLTDGELEKLQIRIQDEPPGKEERKGKQEAGLLIRLRFEFTAAGAISAMLHLNDNTLGLHWWAEQAATSDRLRQALPLLESRLHALGLTVSELDCSEGMPPAIDEMPVLYTRGLLNEKA